MSRVRHFLARTVLNPALIALLAAIVGAVVVTAALAGRGSGEPRIPVAVVNNDVIITTGEGDDERTIAAGREVAADLTDPAPDEASLLDFTITEEDRARAGLENGDYYAIVLIPEDFSEGVSRLGTDEPVVAQVVLLVNSVNGRIVGEVSEQVTASTVAAFGEDLTVQYLDNSYQAQSSLSDGLGEAATGADEIAAGTAELSMSADDVATGAAELASGTASVSSSADQLADGADGVSTGARSVSSGADDLVAGATSLTSGIEQVADADAKIASGAGDLARGAAELASGTASVSSSADQLADGADGVSTGARWVSSGADDLVAGATSLTSGIEQVADADAKIASGAGDLASGLAQLSVSANQVADASQQVDQGANETSDGLSILQPVAAGSAVAAAQLKTAVTQLASSCPRDDYPLYCAQVDAALPTAVTVAQQTDGVATGVATLAQGAADLSEGTGSLASSTQSLARGASSSQAAAQALADASASSAEGAADTADGARRLTASSEQLAAGASDLAAGSDDLLAGTTSLAGGASEVNQGASSSQAAAQALADASASSAQGAADTADGARRLTASSEQLAAGASDLAAGSDDLLAGTTSLAGGASEVNQGAAELADGSDSLSEGADSLTEPTDELATSLTETADGIPNYNEEERQRLGQTVAAPVSTEVQDLYPGTDSRGSVIPLAVVSALLALVGAACLARTPLPAWAITSGRSTGRIIVSGLRPALVSIAVASLATLAFTAVGITVARPLQLVLLTAFGGITFLALFQAIVAVVPRRAFIVAVAFLAVQLLALPWGVPIELAPPWVQSLNQVMPVPVLLHALDVAVVGAEPPPFDAFLVLGAWTAASLLVTTSAISRAYRRVQPLPVLAND